MNIDVTNVFFTFLTFFILLNVFYFKKRALKIPSKALRSTFETTE